MCIRRDRWRDTCVTCATGRADDSRCRGLYGISGCEGVMLEYTLYQKPYRWSDPWCSMGVYTLQGNMQVEYSLVQCKVVFGFVGVKLQFGEGMVQKYLSYLWHTIDSLMILLLPDSCRHSCPAESCSFIPKSCEPFGDRVSGLSENNFCGLLRTMCSFFNSCEVGTQGQLNSAPTNNIHQSLVTVLG